MYNDVINRKNKKTDLFFVCENRTKKETATACDGLDKARDEEKGDTYKSGASGAFDGFGRGARHQAMHRS